MLQTPNSLSAGKMCNLQVQTCRKTSGCYSQRANVFVINTWSFFRDSLVGEHLPTNS